jgi:hypothetical protein
MWLMNLFLVLLVQAPPATEKVVVGLTDGQQVVMENADFVGLIQGHGGEAVLAYRQQKLHGQIPVKDISRIDFVEYRKGQPFALTLTLKNGQKLEVESQRQQFVVVKGRTNIGVVTIKHPDPTITPLRVTSQKVNRKKDLTIQYLEFPAS